jgi:DNA-3-methyladenine glycosylase
MNTIFDRAFYQRPATELAPDLLGVIIAREIEGQVMRAVVVETEAYQGMEDKACHASRGKTKRNAVMFGAAGHAYVYFTYGMHWMLNVVCDDVDLPAAVLIRAVLALEGMEAMRARRERDFGKPGWLNGPAKLCQALGIDGALNGADICARTSALWFESGFAPKADMIKQSARIGIGYAAEPWLSVPWRWYIDSSAYSDLIRL